MKNAEANIGKLRQEPPVKEKEKLRQLFREAMEIGSDFSGRVRVA